MAKNTFLESADLIAKDYIENFIKDFLCISDETLKQENFEVTTRVPIEKLHIVKSCSKSAKNRNQVKQKISKLSKYFLYDERKIKNIL